MNDLQRNALVWFAVFSAAGWIALIVGLWRRRAWRAREERERARTDGAIVGTDPSVGGRPVVEFTVEGTLYRQACAGAHPVGEAVEVRYDPDDPTRFHLQTGRDDSGRGRALILAGVAWIALCALLATGVTTLRGRFGAELRYALRRLHITDITTLFGGGSGDSGAKNSGSYEYTPKDELYAVLRSYRGSEESVTVPTFLDGRVVCELAPGAYARSDTIVRLTVPGLIPEIPTACFTACARLQEVVLREGVQAVRSHAFSLCTALRRVVLPASLERIDDDAFPDDCPAVFEVIEGSAAQRYCREKGFSFTANPAE